MTGLDPGVAQHIEHERSAQRQRERDEAKRRIEDGRPPWEEERGLMAVVDAARDVSFPRTFDDLRREVGDREVAVSGHTKLPMADVVRRLGAKVNDHDPLLDGGEVPSLKDFQSIAQRHWEAIEFMALPEGQRPTAGGVHDPAKGTSPSGRS